MIIDVHTHINNYHEDRVVSLRLAWMSFVKPWKKTRWITPWY